jgi:hypothetical protein
MSLKYRSIAENVRVFCGQSVDVAFVFIHITASTVINSIFVFPWGRKTTFCFGEWRARRRDGRVVETCMFGIRRDL